MAEPKRHLPAIGILFPELQSTGWASRRRHLRLSSYLRLSWPATQLRESDRSRRHGILRTKAWSVRRLGQVQEDLPVALPFLFLRELRVGAVLRHDLLHFDVGLVILLAFGALGRSRDEGVGREEDVG